MTGLSWKGPGRLLRGCGGEEVHKGRGKNNLDRGPAVQGAEPWGRGRMRTQEKPHAEVPGKHFTKNISGAAEVQKQPGHSRR